METKNARRLMSDILARPRSTIDSHTVDERILENRRTRHSQQRPQLFNNRIEMALQTRRTAIAPESDFSDEDSDNEWQTDNERERPFSATGNITHFTRSRPQWKTMTDDAKKRLGWTKERQANDEREALNLGNF